LKQSRVLLIKAGSLRSFIDLPIMHLIEIQFTIIQFIHEIKQKILLKFSSLIKEILSKTLDCFNGKYQIRHFSLLKVSVTVGIEIEYFLQHKKIIGKGDFRFIGLCYLVFMVTSSNVSAIPCLLDLFGTESLQTYKTN
jgi:hypothetical protein